MLICGGIGITPCLSLWKHYLNSAEKPKKVIFIWHEKNVQSFEGIYADQFAGRISDKEIVRNVEESNPETLIKADSIFDYHFYLTREKSVETAVKPVWNAGRLDLNLFFQLLTNHVMTSYSSDHGKPRVGVVVCGPLSLVVSTQETSKKFRSEVNYDIHEEFFGL